MKKNDIAIIGLYPPPIGGVSIHIERLTKYLEDNNKSFILYDTSKISMKLWLIKYLFKSNEKLIHLHERNWYLVAIICFIARLHNSKVILTLHSFREDPCEFNFIKAFAFKYSINRLHYFIPVGENEKNKLIRYGADPKKITVIPAYINPKYKREDDLLIPEYVWEHIDSSSFCICANASKLSFYNNQDIYGLDLCIELCCKLKTKYRDRKIKFIFCLPEIGDYKYYNMMKERIKKFQIQKEFLIVNEKIPLYPILRRVHIFLRSTSTDSYGVSIAEAIYFKVPSIASNVCNRPEGTILFKSRDINDLYSKTVDVIENYSCYKNKLKNIRIEDNAKKILDVYKEIMGT